MPCLACGRQFHEECETSCEECHPLPKQVPLQEVKLGRPQKDPESMKDRKSSGRKRAAELYPIDLKADCEWKGLKNCGGGKVPVVGCVEGLQTDRHHGPIKDPVRNEQGNVHRICKPCHNHWHELNDLDYEETVFAETKHSPVAATPMELEINRLKWKNGLMKQEYVLASSMNRKSRIQDD